MAARRALHFVFKVGDRKETIKFYTEILGMKVLRHEEFEEGCKASCNGPYDGKWSKTMIGYGPEDNHFVAELTYNYGIKSYKLGNDFMGITLKSDSIIDKAKKHDWPVKEENDLKFVEAPGGYRYFIVDEVQLDDSDPVKKVTLACSNLQKSTEFWCDILNMKKYGEEDNSVILGYSEEQCKLELREIGKPVNHEQAFGRIAFSCPTDELAGIQEQVKTAGCKILTPLISLDTPGKATVHVVILADPDGHEICFVGDEAFRELSKVDPKAEGLLNDAIAADKSDEWFAKKGKSKVEM
ncbi:glyoxalase domain-containing protein 4-like isoform X1 [Stegodyphus dumicola]|uniref:glyoxalase domain-containing protein 4-like isoform X1 n=2 Tax=Stegodyphus dumicola TaxID=202533 RepID=UPI0015A9E224|nr:glyoxalase domain-containing protein 4-like isoform X1 [Stegodyphus dumicola]